jgi:DNA-directed RNA polymerase subunit RPC12/RpoP
VDKYIKCPGCKNDALYKYGKTPDGKQKYQCLVCGRQFVADSPRENFEKRPVCPKCGAKMHIYMKEKHTLRFRCASYPVCKNYLKINTED